MSRDIPHPPASITARNVRDSRDHGIHADKRVVDRRLLDPDIIERINARSVVLILTHQKAGTHYVRFFLAN